jgi:hypothetical protein
MNGRKKLIAGVVAGGVMLGTAVAGPAQAGPNAYSPSATFEYLYLVRSDPDAAPLAGFSDAWLVHEGEGSCTMMRNGYSHPYVMAGIRSDAGLPFSTNADVTVIAAAEVALCPDQNLLLNPGAGAPSVPGQAV